MRRVLVCTAILGLAACDRPAPPAAPSTPPAPPPAALPATALEPAPAPDGPIRALVIPDPAHTRTVSLRHAGIVSGVLHAAGETVKAGDVLIEIDSPEIARAVFDLRKLETEYLAAKGAQSNAEARVETQKALAEARAAAATIAEEQMIALRLADEPLTSRNLTDVRLLAISLRAEAGELAQGVEAARREVAQQRDRADAVLRAAAALRTFIGPHIDPPGSQGRWGADVERPNIVRLTSPVDGQIVATPARIGEGLAAGAALVRVMELAGIALQPTAEDEPRLIELAGKTVSVRASDSGTSAEGIVHVEWTGEEGGRRAWVTLGTGAADFKLGSRVVITPAPPSPVIDPSAQPTGHAPAPSPTAAQ